MGTRIHYCPDGPEADEDGWAPGGSDQCSQHGSKLTTLTSVRMSGKDRRKADKASGTVGQDRGGYING